MLQCINDKSKTKKEVAVFYGLLRAFATINHFLLLNQMCVLMLLLWAEIITLYPILSELQDTSR
jgi:hypothetical protein